MQACCVQVSSQLEQWAEELQHAELSAELAKAEQLLVMHVESAQHMQAAVFEMLQRGQELVQVRQKLFSTGFSTRVYYCEYQNVELW